MQNQNTEQGDNLVTLWEQMGSSTGGFLGRLIGLSAQYMLESYRQAVVEPLRQANSSFSVNSTAGNGPQGIRENTWREMGRDYGETVGKSVGMAMDLLINSLKTSADAAVPGFKEQSGSQQTGSQSMTPK